jgi:hypothetical protein
MNPELHQMLRRALQGQGDGVVEVEAGAVGHLPVAGDFAEGGGKLF